MFNTCKNCGYRGSGYIKYIMPSAILCWCKYHDCKVTGPTCYDWKPKDMTGDNVPIERKDNDMDESNSWELGAKISKEMDNTCKNCAYAILGGTCFVSNKRIDPNHAPCHDFTRRDSIKIEDKDVRKLPDGGIEVKCRLADDKRPDWFKNMFNDKDETEKEYDPVNSPKHYTSGKVECIDAMIETFGVEAVKHFCLCNAFKYHWRHELKNGDEDIKKATWYMDKYKELENR